MPCNTSASKAFPSSSNSSTLSELAVGRLDNPCKSPDCSPRRLRGFPDRSATVSTPWPLVGTRFLFGDVFFIATEDFLEAACFGAIFLAAAFFRFVCLFLFGMLSVYHRFSLLIPGVGLYENVPEAFLFAA